MDMEIKSYSMENYVSVWIGKCESLELFNEYMDKNYGADDEDSKFMLGKDFGIQSYNEDFMLVYYDEKSTTKLSVLLDTGAPDYVMDYFIEKYGEELEEEYNCAVMFYDMKYEGERNKFFNEKYGEFWYLGNLSSNKFDML